VKRIEKSRLSQFILFRMELLDVYSLFRIAKTIGSDYKSLFNFILTQRYLVNFLRMYKFYTKELKKQILIEKKGKVDLDGKTVFHILPNGARYGKYEEWHSNGQLSKHCFYKNDKLKSECKEWWDNGQLHRHKFYKDGQLEGESKVWTKKGRFFSQSFSHNGTGEYKEWYENGQIAEHYKYENNLYEGEWKSWWFNGQAYQRFYVKGIPISIQYEVMGKLTTVFL